MTAHETETIVHLLGSEGETCFLARNAVSLCEEISYGPSTAAAERTF
jgi:hypothetical protein